MEDLTQIEVDKEQVGVICFLKIPEKGPINQPIVFNNVSEAF